MLVKDHIMTITPPRLTHLILALLLTVSFGDVEATDIKHTLIKTDQQLNATYQTLTKKLNPKDQKKLRQEQRAWIKQRDKKCKTQKIKATGRRWLNTVAKNKSQTECVIRLTQKRAGKLKGHTQTKAKKQYPPYPEVWGRQLPYIGSELIVARVYPEENGDICIMYVREDRTSKVNILKERGFQYAYIRFFSGERPPLPCYKAEKNMEYKRNKWMSSKASEIIKFDNGKKMQARVQWNELNRYCFNPFGTYFEVKDKTGKVIMKKSVLFILYKPYLQSLGATCEGEEADATVRIKSVGSYMLLLKDQTFILYSPIMNRVIRFDSNFNTKYPINRDRVYIIDTKKLNRIMAGLDKKYGIDAHKYIFDAVLKEVKKTRDK